MVLDYPIIGERLKKIRRNKKITQEALAEQLDVSVAFLSRVERGDIRVNLTRLNQLCEILDVPLTTILDGVGCNSENYLNSDFSELLKNCPPDKLKLIYDIAKVIINSDN